MRRVADRAVAVLVALVLTTGMSVVSAGPAAETSHACCTTMSAPGHCSAQLMSCCPARAPLTAQVESAPSAASKVSALSPLRTPAGAVVTETGPDRTRLDATPSLHQPDIPLYLLNSLLLV